MCINNLNIYQIKTYIHTHNQGEARWVKCSGKFLSSICVKDLGFFFDQLNNFHFYRIKNILKLETKLISENKTSKYLVLEKYKIKEKNKNWLFLNTFQLNH